MLTCCFIMKRRRDLSSDSQSNGRKEKEEKIDDMEGPLAILWDIDNCCIPSGLSPDIAVDNTRKYLRRHGIKAPITLFSAYGDFGNRSSIQTESCQRSGVNLIHVPSLKKDAADKAIVVDMLLFAMDNPPPSSILLISGDVDFSAALHKLGQRGHSILVATTNLRQTSYALLSAAKFVWEWPQMASNGNFQITTQRFQPQFLPNVAGNYFETIRESNPALTMQVSRRPNNCGWLAETTSNPSPASLMQHSKLKHSGIDVVKEEILSLLDRNGGCITLSEIPALYKRTFKKTLSSWRYGCEVKTLLEKMGEDIHVHGQGNTACVYLISQGKCLCPQSNMNSNAPNQKNVIEAGDGLPSETEMESNRTQMMQPTKIGTGDCGLPSQIITGDCGLPCNISLSAYGWPYQTRKLHSTSLEQPTTNRRSDIRVVKNELRTLLSRNRKGILLGEIANHYKQTFKKEFCAKDYGCKLKTLLRGIAYMRVKSKNRTRVFFRPEGR